MTDSEPVKEATGLVRPYVITRGRGQPTNVGVDMATLVTTNADIEPPAALGPEKLLIIELCLGGTLSVSEVAVQVGLSIGVARVLVSDMVDAKYVSARAPIVWAMADIHVLQEIIDGLARL